MLHFAILVNNLCRIELGAHGKQTGFGKIFGGSCSSEKYSTVAVVTVAVAAALLPLLHRYSYYWHRRCRCRCRRRRHRVCTKRMPICFDVSMFFSFLVIKFKLGILDAWFVLCMRPPHIHMPSSVRRSIEKSRFVKPLVRDTHIRFTQFSILFFVVGGRGGDGGGDVVVVHSFSCSFVCVYFSFAYWTCHTFWVHCIELFVHCSVFSAYLYGVR